MWAIFPKYRMLNFVYQDTGLLIVKCLTIKITLKREISIKKNQRKILLLKQILIFFYRLARNHDDDSPGSG